MTIPSRILLLSFRMLAPKRLLYYLKATGRWFSELGGENDESFKSLRMKIWQLRAAVIYSLRPFDSKELRIEEKVLNLQRDMVYLPFLKERMDRLLRIVNFLID